MVVIRWFVLNRFAGLWFVARFAHKDFRRSLIITGLQFAWRAIRLVAVTAMKTTAYGMAAAESSRILRCGGQNLSISLVALSSQP